MNKPFIAIVAWGADNRVTKYWDFLLESDADSHINKIKDIFPSAFRATDPGGGYPDWLVSGKSLVFSPAAPPLPPTDEERIDAVFPQSDSAQVIFEAFFIVVNRLQTLESQPPITKIQLKNWFKSRLPLF